jgi:hypothetical protein
VIGERKVKLATRVRHAIAAETDAFDARKASLQGAYEVGAVNIAARFADAEKDAHEDVLVQTSDQRAIIAKSGDPGKTGFREVTGDK